MDIAVLYRNLESNVLRRDRIGRTLRRNCGRALREEELGIIVNQIKSLRTSRRALIKILSKLRELESFEGFEEPLSTIIEYMIVVGVHIEKEVLFDAAELLKKYESTKTYAKEICDTDVVEVEKLLEDLKATYTAIKARYSS
ncbi:MAG: hypothetical protein N3G79_03155 [Sulfolobales archaeon]|nr:hypothetical protein [Sulfolobales archaeon]